MGNSRAPQDFHVARRACGCLVSAVADDPECAEAVIAMIAAWTGAGRDVVRVSAADWKNIQLGCGHTPEQIDEARRAKSAA